MPATAKELHANLSDMLVQLGQVAAEEEDRIQQCTRWKEAAMALATEKESLTEWKRTASTTIEYLQQQLALAKHRLATADRLENSEVTTVQTSPPPCDEAISAPAAPLLKGTEVPSRDDMPRDHRDTIFELREALRDKSNRVKELEEALTITTARLVAAETTASHHPHSLSVASWPSKRRS